MEKVSVEIHGRPIREVQDNENFPIVSRYLRQRQQDIAKLLGTPEAGKQAWLGRRSAAILFLQTNRELLEAQMATAIPNAAEDLELGDKDPAIHVIQQDLNAFDKALGNDSTSGDERTFVLERAQLGLTALASLVSEEQMQQQRKRFLLISNFPIFSL